ncbi:hypothetical protein I4U23_001458 [Adineta vaga]|nr:hypothetical protein I4U23_001458 [Adineta vaga]
MSTTNNNVITVQNEIPMVRLPVPENERQGGKGLSSLRSTFSLLPTLPENELIDIFHHNLTKKHWGTKLWRRCRQAGLLSYIGYSSFILFTILAITVSIIIVCLTSGKKKGRRLDFEKI